MKKFFSLIVFTVALVLFACLCAVGIIVNSVTGWGVLAAIGYAAAGVAAFYLLHNLLHESFHALFALISGGKITTLSFWCVEFDFLSKKICFKPSSVYAGWTSFLCKKPQNAEKTLNFSLAGGLLGSVLSLFVAFLLGFVTKNGVFSSEFFFAGGLSVCIYMLSVNFIPLVDGNDGSLLFVKGSAFVAAAERIETESNLYLGKTLARTFPLTLEKKYGKRPASVYDAWYFLSLKDEGTAKAVLNNLIENSGDNEVIAPLTERFFIACVEKDGAKIAAYKERVVDSFNDELFSLRAHAAYRLFTGEREWAKALCETYRRIARTYPLKGLAETDAAIFEAYLGKSF